MTDDLATVDGNTQLTFSNSLSITTCILFPLNLQNSANLQEEWN